MKKSVLASGLLFVCLTLNAGNSHVAFGPAPAPLTESATANGGAGAGHESRQRANTTALKTSIANARAVLASAEEYLPDAVADLRGLTALAEKVAEGTCTQTYTDNIRLQLNSAINQAKATRSIVLPTSVQLAGSYDTQRGFIHPGGLHTQADFDRIKRQLAEKNERVTEAYNVLKSAAYAQSGVQTSPVATIVRGGSGENYINAARGATMAYQNALRWKIEDNPSCAAAAVRILMAWARTTKVIGGDSNYALAAGLYGYQFAQAAELVRDYEGWSRDDFEAFRQWMLSVWYPSAVGFLRARNGTWANTDKWWQAPGHYWSNWGLCNALCLVSIGVLCDDVFIYNQGMSYFKYDQVGTFRDPRTENPIKNDGLTEFLGNLVVTTSKSELETGAYGRLGQMQESGRDIGHSAMAAGLAIDLAKVGWNQGDDLFAYMDHRLAAGIEYIAAQTQSVEGLPWTNYHYGTNGLHWSDSRTWIQDAPALGAQTRPYWGTVIGIYEGVKGVRMPFSKTAYEQMGIDAGGQGSTSGGYDHMGYSVLMNTRDQQLAPADSVPTELSPRMSYSGSVEALIPCLEVERTLGNVSGNVVAHNELGGLINTFQPNNQTCVPRGEALTLMPQLPDGEEDTGQWLWDTGETTRDITVTTDRSHVYRVTYTNANGIRSRQCFPIAVENDCNPARLTPSITCNGQTFSDADSLEVLYGQTVTLGVVPSCDWGTYRWSTGQTTASVTTVPLTEARTYTVYYTNQGSAVSAHTFHLNVITADPYILQGTTQLKRTEAIVEAGDNITLGINLPDIVRAEDVDWGSDLHGATLALDNVQTSGTYTASFPFGDEIVSVTFTLRIKETGANTLETGNYLIRHIETGRLLTAHGAGQTVAFEAAEAEPASGQIWYADSKNGTRWGLINLPDSLHLNTTAKLTSSALYPFYMDRAAGTNHYAIRTGATASSTRYWEVDADGTLLTTASTTLDAFPFELIRLGETDAIASLPRTEARVIQTEYFSTTGIRLRAPLQKGITLVRQRFSDNTVHTFKMKP